MIIILNIIFKYVNILRKLATFQEDWKEKPGTEGGI